MRLFVLKSSRNGKRKRGNGRIDDRSVRELNESKDDVPATKICKFLLYKENMDTQHAMQMLCKHLHVKRSRFGKPVFVCFQSNPIHSPKHAVPFSIRIVFLFFFLKLTLNPFSLVCL